MADGTAQGPDGPLEAPAGPATPDPLLGDSGNGAGPSTPAPHDDEATNHATYRGWMHSAAAKRGIPLPTILTTVFVVFIVLDVNALVILLLWTLRRILLYLVMGSFVALLLSPIVRLLQRLRMGRGLAVAIVSLVAVIATIALVYSFTQPLVNGITKFAHDLPNLVRQAEHGRGPLGGIIKRLHLEQWVRQNASKIGNSITHSLKPAQALSVGSAAVSTVGELVIIAFMSLFILIYAPAMRRSILGSMSPARGARVSKVYDEVVQTVTGYMAGNIATSVIAGVVMFITLVIMGVPFAGLLGLWVALVDLLPMVGGLLAGVVVAVVALFHSLPAFIVVVVVFLVYQQIENHVLNPLIMGKTVRLNPFWVLLAALVGGTLGARIGGGLGAFIGTLVGIPTGGAIQVTVREIRRGPTSALPEVADHDGAGPAPSPSEP